MKLCIPVALPDGLESIIEPHLPSAEHLLLFDAETRLYEEVSLRDQEAGASEAIQLDAVLCGSINRATLRTLMEQGVNVYGTAAKTVAQAIAQFENGELEAATPQGGGCGGHGGGGCCSGGDGHAEGKAVEHHCNGGGGCGGHGKESGHGHGHGHESGGCCGSRTAEHDLVPEKLSSDVLRIAVCSQNRKTVTEHAGKCRKFWIYEVKQGQVIDKKLLELPIEQSFHSSPVGEAHPLDVVNILISAGMGSGLQQRLLQRGIQGVVTTEESPDLAVAAFLAGDIARLPPDRAWISPCSHESDSAHVFATGHE